MATRRLVMTVRLRRGEGGGGALGAGGTRLFELLLPLQIYAKWKNNGSGIIGLLARRY